MTLDLPSGCELTVRLVEGNLLCHGRLGEVRASASSGDLRLDHTGDLVTRRCWDFLVRHLMGAEPPEDYRLAPIPFDPSMI
ncbi:hypothetical protein [Nonomuraea sp. NPDC050540]|uniref:hypothetical protein n=1 Tax=Nonomuraea sp. NPDC050540 TaxID=3364367 RepID=UPI0037B85508